ncbi:MAG: N-acetylmuramoyl-L-alanine amidase, partial [Alphaproteobacteria bacterium]|nr:N-acetylmuramoyl-L-alanine amidase [Alphaproteobacteria bacterium]
KKPIIVLDPGHGGKDPGAIGKNRTLEKNVVLAVGKKVEALLKRKGYEVHMTRRTDKYLKLKDRSRFGQDKKADLFISIHADSNPNRSARGLSVYTLSEKATDQESAKLAERENAADLIGISGFENYDKNTQFILGEFGQNLAVQEGIILAELIVSAVKKADEEVKYLKTTHRSAPFAVLKSTVPSALAELGFLSNPVEEKLLGQDSHQTKLAEVIVKAVSKYSFA